MNRNIVNTMNLIFEALKRYIDDEEIHRVASVKRHIKAAGNNEPVCEFVMRAKVKSFFKNTMRVCIYEFGENKFLLLPEKYASALREIGFEIEEDIAIVQGAGMLAMGLQQWPIREGLSSLDIIENCLGIEEEDIEFEFPFISKLFEDYCVIRLDDGRFELLYEEDVNRLCCYILANETTRLNVKAKATLQELLLLRSTRSVAASIINGFRSPLEEYTFLQLYQCLEYLYRLNNCFSIAKENNVELGKAIDIVTTYEFKISEEENLYRVISVHASDASVEAFIKMTSLEQSENNDKSKIVSRYIYKLRCNIAHLRYAQDSSFDNINWDVCIEALINIIYSVYQKLDEDIYNVCDQKGVWIPLVI